MRKEYFEQYLLQIRRVKAVTVQKYDHALSKIANVLRQRGAFDLDSLYEVDSYSQLMTLKRELLQDEEFVTLDTDGNRMYTSGLNRYIDFVEGQYFTAIADPLRLLDQPLDVRQSRRTSAREVPSRDSIIVRQVIIAERHRCLVNEEHLTFTSARYGTPYMEGHHLIPLRDQHRFYYSLDVYANIVPLCPICHRLLHHAVTEERKPVWQQLFTLRQDRLADSGLRMSTREFIEFMEQQAPVSSVVY